MKIDYTRLSFETKGCPPLYESPALLAHDKNSSWPIVYFRRPKHIPADVFNEIIRRMRIHMEAK